MTTTYRILRDGSALVWEFDAVPGLEAFGWAKNGKVYIRGEKGDQMPGLVATDWLRDHGFEPSRVR